jgi:hypothetical protein|tara:strand:- start:3807 stop:4352 length:546 start_codon:yes stop_codon:yes gene_type:complete
VIIIPINDELIPELEVFCKKAKELGYVNNSSLKLMRYDWCKENGEFYCAIKGDDIVAVAGCHTLPEFSPNAWRIMFRGCELPGASPYKGLNKGDWNSITQRDFIPEFINYIPSEELYISTNISNEHSGKALRNHKIMNILARQKDAYIIDVCDMMLNNVHQTIWKLNIEQYLSRRSKLNVV